MFRLTVLVMNALLIFLPLAVGGQNSGQDLPLYHLETQLVQIYLTITEGSRRIPDLKLADFSLSEDGRPKEIGRLDSAEVPLYIALLLDCSDSMRESLPAVREAAAQFVNSLAPGDRVALIPFNSNIRLVPHLTDDRSPILQAIANSQPSGGTKLYDALLYAMKHLQANEGRKAIVLFSDGEDTARTSSLEVVLNAASRYGFPIYSIGSGAGTSRDRLQRILRQLSEINSGQTIMISDTRSLQGAFSEVLAELHSAYVLNYYTSVPHDGLWHDVKITLSNPRHKVHARMGFYARSAGSRSLLSELGQEQAGRKSGISAAKDDLPATEAARRAVEDLAAMAVPPPALEKPLQVALPPRRTAPDTRKTPTFKVETRFVEVPVAIESAGDGNPPLLSESDFRIYEDNSLREIAYFSREGRIKDVAQMRDTARRKLGPQAASLPLNGDGPQRPLARCYLVLDNLMSDASAFLLAKIAAEKILRENHHPLRPISLHFTSELQASVLPDESLEQMISKLRKAVPQSAGRLNTNDGIMTVHEAYLIERGDRQARMLAELRYAGSLPARFENELGSVDGENGYSTEMIANMVQQTARDLIQENLGQGERALGGIHAAISAASSDPGDYPKSIILVSSGFCLGRMSMRADLTRMLDAASNLARQRGIRIHTVDASGLQNDETLGISANGTFLVRNPHLQGILASHARDWRMERQSPLHEMAQRTGGLFRHSTNDLAAATTAALQRTGQLYFLGFLSQQPVDGRFHQIRVTSSQRNCRIIARKGFFATAQAPASQSEKAELDTIDWQDVAERANEARRSGNMKELTSNLELLTRRYPDQANLWYHLGIAQLQSNNPQAALNALQQAYSLAPDDRDVGISLAGAFVAAGFRSAAGRILESMLRRQPHDTSLILRLGLVFEATGNPERAYQIYRKILDLERSPALEVYLLLARTASSLERRLETDVFIHDYLARGGAPEKVEPWRKSRGSGSN